MPDKLTIAVPQIDLLLMREALQIGFENSQERLSIHDATLGRQHRHNRLTAEALEWDCDQIAKALNVLNPLCQP